MSHSATWPHIRRSIGGIGGVPPPAARAWGRRSRRAGCAPARAGCRCRPAACSRRRGRPRRGRACASAGASAAELAPQRVGDRGGAAAAQAEVVGVRALRVRVAGDAHERRVGLGDPRRRLGDPRLRPAGERRAVEREQHVGGERHRDPVARTPRVERLSSSRARVEREVLHGQREVEHAVRRAGLREGGRRGGEQQRRRRAAAARLLGDRDVTERLEVRDQQVDLA